jgi:hypothetical protein
MKHCSRILLGATALAVCANWSSEFSTEPGVYKKQKINIYGTVLTQEAAKLKKTPLVVNNISISNMTDRIILFEEQNTDKAERKLANDNKTTYITLPTNPKKTASPKLDLAEIKKIKVPEENTLYVYTVVEKKAGSEKPTTVTTEYIKIIKVLNDSKNTESAYLIDNKQQLFFHEKNEAGPQEHTLPLSGLKELVIEGYKKRKTEKELQEERKQYKRANQKKSTTTFPMGGTR